MRTGESRDLEPSRNRARGRPPSGGRFQPRCTGSRGRSSPDPRGAPGAGRRERRDCGEPCPIVSLHMRQLAWFPASVGPRAGPMPPIETGGALRKERHPDQENCGCHRPISRAGSVNRLTFRHATSVPTIGARGGRRHDACSLAGITKSEVTQCSIELVTMFAPPTSRDASSAGSRRRSASTWARPIRRSSSCGPWKVPGHRAPSSSASTRASCPSSVRRFQAPAAGRAGRPSAGPVSSMCMSLRGNVPSDERRRGFRNPLGEP
jgi:hypothetical protein